MAVLKIAAQPTLRTDYGPARFGALLQFPLQEIDRRVVSAQPGRVPQEGVNLIRDNQLLEVHALLP